MGYKVPDTIKVAKVTPETAHKWLELRYDNERNVRQAKRQAFARDMTNGTWYFIGDPIRFDQDGRLIDGQHRLLAVIDSDTTQYFPIVGIPAEARAAIDTGTARTLGDLLSIGNHIHGKTLAAIVRRLLIYRDGQQGTTEGGSGYQPTFTESVSFVEGNKDALHRSVEVALEAARSKLPIAPSVVGMVHYLTTKVEPDLAKDFFHKLVHGTGLDEDDPVMALRNRGFRELKNTGRPMHPDDALRFTIIAWNHIRAGRRVTRLQTPRGGWRRSPVPRVE